MPEVCLSLSSLVLVQLACSAKASRRDLSKAGVKEKLAEGRKLLDRQPIGLLWTTGWPSGVVEKAQELGGMRLRKEMAGPSAPVRRPVWKCQKDDLSLALEELADGRLLEPPLPWDEDDGLSP